MPFRKVTIIGIMNFSLILFMFTGCSLFMTETEWNYYLMRPHSVLSIESGGVRTPIVFKISSSLNTPCNEYSHSDIDQDNFDISVKFYQKSEKSIRCTAVMVDTVIHWGFMPESAGEYRFHFWKSDSTSLDTAVVVR